MNIEEAKKVIGQLVDGNDHLPIMLWSGPGIGKSAIIRQIAEEKSMDFIDLRLSLLNPVDLRGIPCIDREHNSSKWLPPEFLPSKPNSKGILFLDEINLAPFATMAAGYQLILDRRLGDYVLPKNWKIVAAGNRAEDNSNTTKFPSPLSNRFIHIDIEPNERIWRKWAIKSKVAEEVLAFLGKFPQHLYKFPQAGEKRFPTPRSWELASKLFKAGQDVGIAIGEGVASEFYSFIKVFKDLPDIDAVLAGKEKEVPKSLDVLWALSMALITRVEAAQIPALMNYVSNFPKEFEVLTIINLSEKSKDIENALITSKEWKEWTEKNKEIIDENI